MEELYLPLYLDKKGEDKSRRNHLENQQEQKLK